jgi:hypothetical protein
MALSKTTQDHDEIRKWAEARGAQPAEVKSTHSDDEAGILRFCFPNAPNRNDSKLHEISWDEFFEKFDDNGLELIYQEKTADGQRSNFNKLIYPGDEHAHKSSRGSSRTSARASQSRSGSSSAKSSRSNSSRSMGSTHSRAHSTHTMSGKSSRSGTSGKSSSSGRSSHSTSSRKKAA